MSSIWVSAQECSQHDLAWMTELIRKDKDLQIILSCDPPMFEAGEQKVMLDRRVSDLLVRLGVRPNLKGYQYLRVAVKLCLNDREELDGITKRLYPSVARKCGATSAKVEHAVRHAIETAWEKGNEREQKAVFGYSCREGKRPTNSEFITQLVEYVEKMNRPLYS